MASRLQDVIQRGLSAARPLATAVAPGTLYYSSDLSITERSDGTTWQTYTDGGGGAGSISVAKLAAPFVVEAEEYVYEPQLPFQGPPGPAGSITTAQKTHQIGITVDGAGSAISTGTKGYKSFPVAGVITRVRLLADQAGSAVVDIWKDTFAAYPPTVADTITAAAKPTLTAADHSEDTGLAGWTTAVAAGDVFGFHVDSAATIQRLTLELTIVVT
jgi:hypothetical protein